MKRALHFTVTLLLCASIFAPRAHAVGNNITISPAQVDIELATTDIKKAANFTITNSYNVPVELSVELKGIDQAGGRIIPSDDVDQGLLASVHLSDTLITIPEQTTTFVTLEVSNMTELSPGGHYGTVVFTQQKFGDKDVNFTQAISAGLFVVKRGGQLREIDTTTFKTHAFPFQIPGKADVIMKNIGNVHLTPRASVLVYDWRKTLVAKGIANNQSRRVLPGKEFQDTFKIVQSKKLWLPQKLKVVFEYRADSIEEAKYVTSTQLYIPPYLFVIVAVALIGAAVIGKRKLKKRKQRRAKQRVIATEAVDHQPPADDPQKDVAEPVEIPDAGPEVFTKKHSKKRRNISVSSLEP